MSEGNENKFFLLNRTIKKIVDKLRHPDRPGDEDYKHNSYQNRGHFKLSLRIMKKPKKCSISPM